MDLRQALGGGWLRLLRREGGERGDTDLATQTPPGGQQPVSGDDIEAIQARMIARHTRRQTEAGAEVDAAQHALRLWNDFFARFREDERQFERADYAQAGAELQARIDALNGAAPDPVLCRDMLEMLATITAQRVDQLNARIDELQHGTRAIQRQAGAQELKASHLKDELDRCRKVVVEEWSRRQLPSPELKNQPPADVHELLSLLFAEQGSAIAASSSADPVFQVLDQILANNNPASIRNLPEWLRRPAARLIELMVERNRYRRILENHGMLPP